MKTANGEGKFMRYPHVGGKLFFIMTTAIAVDGSTNVPVEAIAGSFGATTHNTGKTHPFISDGTKWINANISGPFAFGDITGVVADNANLLAALNAKVGKAWVVVPDASATVSPAASDSGKYYRLSHANPTFFLPTVSLVVGETEFYATFLTTGIVDAGTGKTVDAMKINFSPQAAQLASNVVGGMMYHMKYVATNKWASTLIVP